MVLHFEVAMVNGNERRCFVFFDSNLKITFYFCIWYFCFVSEFLPEFLQSDRQRATELIIL